MNSQQPRPSTYDPAIAAFRSTNVGSIGVELECQIVDPQSLELAPGALRVLDACKAERLEGISKEFLQSCIEVKTDVCRDVVEVRDQLGRRLRSLADVTRAAGYELNVAGTHPIARPSMSAVYPDERYDRIRERHGWFAYQESIFGLHVHVGVPDHESAIGVVNAAIPYIPHLLAVSANSPFWEGVDTSHASTRARMFHPSAVSGIPPYLADWRDFVRYYEVLRRAGAVSAMKDFYWDVRPRADLGTVEFRIFDAPKNFAHLLALTALVRSLVLQSLRDFESDASLRRGDPTSNWLAETNRFLAARYGLSAQCARRADLAPTLLADDVVKLIAKLRPLAREWGELEFLETLLPIDETDTGAEWQRREMRRTGRWQNVVEMTRRAWFEDTTPASAAPPTILRFGTEAAVVPPPISMQIP